MATKLKNVYSYLTAKKRGKLSFPVRILLEKGLLKGKILDYGCGFGSDVTLLKEKNYDIKGYDPHYYPDLHHEKFDTIICIYVLNVLTSEEQSKVLMHISSLLKNNGKAYFAVRRDIKHEGFRLHRIHKKPTYQCIVNLPYYSILKNDFTEIYRYTPITLNKNYNSPFIKNHEACLVAESATAFAIYDKYPVNEGHCLVIPKRIIADYFELSFREQNALTLMVAYVKDVLTKQYHPDGFNIGVNIGQAAGQTISHVHIHVIPRYDGDMDNPTGGVRNVIPEKGNYLKE